MNIKPVLNIFRGATQIKIKEIEMDSIMKFLEALSDELETNGSVWADDTIITNLKSLCNYLESKTGEIYNIE